MTPTKVHCLFEQSGTFKNEFIKLGIPAEDYDIQNHYGETDNVVDLSVDKKDMIEVIIGLGMMAAGTIAHKLNI
jgi:hypothetical protein